MAEKKASFLAKHKNRVISLLVCFGISGTCMGMLWDHYRHPKPDSLIASLENRLLDFRFNMRGTRAPSGKIGILAIDEKTLQKFGRWPIARKHYEQVFENLKKLETEWVGLDVVWSEPERPLLEDVADNLTRLKGMSPSEFSAVGSKELGAIDDVMQASLGDRSVARAFKTHGKTVMGYIYYGNKFEGESLGEARWNGLEAMTGSALQAVVMPDGKELKDYPQFASYGIVANTDYIASQGEHFAFFNNELSADAIFRWIQLVRTVEGNLMPAMSLKMAALMMGREPVIFFDQYGISEVSLMNPDDDQDLLKIPVDLDGRGRMLINHLGPRSTIPHFSMADVYDMKLTDAEKKQLKGMSLMLGPTAIGINDMRANPFDAGFDGVEQHAAVIDNIVSSTFMRRTDSIYVTELSLILGIALLFSPLMVFGKAAISGLGAAVFLAGFYYFDKFFWFQRGEWVYMGMPFIQISTMFVGTMLYKYMTEEREKKKVKGAFGMYLSPDVMNEVLSDPGALKLGGEKKELTVFFSDVRSFTTISEGLTPEKLGELMNEYFTPMEEIIKQTRGVLDKYIGDAIMAFWGAPIKLDNPAETASRAALQMMLALDKIRTDFPKKGFPVVDIGIGLNTGMMSVGNFGSPNRFCYTVMGDEVNLGSRLEGATKDYGIKIMISEKTQKLLDPKEFLTRDLDDIRVKGKLQPVKVFELMRPDMLRAERDIQSLIGEFQAGRAAYQAQDWNKAKKHFLTCMTIRPDDGPSLMYMDRIQEREQEPVIANWDGVYTRKSK